MHARARPLHAARFRSIRRGACMHRSSGRGRRLRAVVVVVLLDCSLRPGCGGEAWGVHRERGVDGGSSRCMAGVIPWATLF